MNIAEISNAGSGCVFQNIGLLFWACPKCSSGGEKDNRIWHGFMSKINLDNIKFFQKFFTIAATLKHPFDYMPMFHYVPQSWLVKKPKE